MIDIRNDLGSALRYTQQKKDFVDITKTLFKFLKIKNDKEISVCLMSNADIKKINKKYRSKDSVTDVISFAFNDAGIETYILGDIIIAPERAKQQAKEYNHSYRREMAFLYCHGLLHLLGYTHDNKKLEKEMFDLQDKVLDELDIKR